MSALAERTDVARDGVNAPVEVASATACDGTCSLRAVHTEPVNADSQRRWATLPLVERLQVIRNTRHSAALQSEAFADAIGADLQRSRSDTLTAELLPLLDAMRFLERNSRSILAPKRLGAAGRPLWLIGVQAETRHIPLGHIVVIGPSNFPLFLPGVQALQALVAGNCVTWKPGLGGRGVALLLANILRANGLPRGVLSITGESVEAAQEALGKRPDKVIFTGSFASGRQVMRALAETATPSVMELSGADAIAVLPSANLAVAAKAIAFGLRLNGAEVCMSPRRLVATPETMLALRPLLEAELATVPPIFLKPLTASALTTLVTSATQDGAELIGSLSPGAQEPLLIANARPSMAITQSDIFAPVLSLLEVPSALHMADIINDCPYALAAAIFGPEREARVLGEQLRVGTVLINDLIAPTADPRVPFGGRGRSGFGVTRGAEGLLEMTATQTILVRRKAITQHYKPLGARDFALFTGLIRLLHGGSLRLRLSAMRAVAAAGRSR